MQSVIRTKMAAALIGAVHTSINSGHNTGSLGRMVLTHEAKGTGVIYTPRAKTKPNRGAPKGQALLDMLQG